jgi:hypothetical protein
MLGQCFSLGDSNGDDPVRVAVLQLGYRRCFRDGLKRHYAQNITKPERQDKDEKKSQDYNKDSSQEFVSKVES